MNGFLVCEHCSGQINEHEGGWMRFGDLCFCSNVCMHTHFSAPSSSEQDFLAATIDTCEQCGGETLHPLVTGGRFYCTPECLNEALGVTKLIDQFGTSRVKVNPQITETEKAHTYKRIRNMDLWQTWLEPIMESERISDACSNGAYYQ